MKLVDYKPNAARHIMVYGEPKSGKSVLAMMLAKYGYKLWYVDGEDSVKSAWAVNSEGKRILSDEDISNIELIRLPDSMTYPIMGETLLKIVKGGPCTVCHEHGKVSCPICSKNPAAITVTIDVNTFTPKDVLVIDSVTQLGHSFISHIKQKEIKANVMADDLKLDWDEWAKQGFLLDRVFSTVQNAKWNCIAISHEEVSKMSDKTESIVPKMGTRNFSKTSAKYFDDIVYCAKVNNKLKQFSSVEYSNNVITGSRSGKRIEKEGSRGLIELFE